MLKKLLTALGVIVILLVGAAVILPALFKDDLVKLVTDEANNSLNAQLELGDIDLSIIQDFPNFTLSLSDVKVTGKSTFDGLVLADIETINLSLDLMSVITGDKIEIITIGLESPQLHVVVLQDGTANYDIAISSDDATEEPEQESNEATSFSVGVQSYYIRNANIIYDDRAGGMYANLKNFTHGGSGDFTQDDFLLKTKTTADAITYKMDGVAYLNQTELDMKFDVQMNLPNMRFVFEENYVRLNALQLGFDGMVAMPEEAGDPIDLDLTFDAKETSFAGILSLVPGAYIEDFDDVETSGKLTLEGMAKGRMIGDQLPAFALDLTVADARFNYPDLPAAAENIAIDLAIKNPGGSEDLTVIDLNRFHVDIADNPVDLILHMRTPISDPYIDATVNTDIDLAIIPTVVPLEEGQSLSGKLFSNLKMKGNQSAIDQERYSDFTAEGQVVLTDVAYQDPELPYATVIESCSLNFSPAFAELTAFRMMIDESDINLSGRINNVLGWYVGEEDLSGTFNFSSSLMDLNAFMADSEESDEAEETTESSEEESGGVAEVPAGYDFTLNTSITKMLYEDLEINNVNGEMVLRDQKLDMRRLSMSLLKGSMTMKGFYETTKPFEPSFDFYMDIIGWDIPTTYAYLDMVQQMAPIMENATGRFSTKVSMAGKMDQEMEPKYNTLDGGGVLITRDVEIAGPEILKKMSKAVKYDGLETIRLNNTEISYHFEDGRIKVDPASFIIGKEVPSIFAGSHGFDMTLDYVLNLDIPTRLMGGVGNQVLSGLLSQANKAMGTNASIPERVKMDVQIGGTSADPVIKPMLAGTEGEGSAGLKGQAKDALNEKKAEVEDRAKEELDKAKDAATKAKDEAEAKARAEADKAKAKAQAEADAAKKKAEAEKRKAEEEAKRKADEAKRKAEEEAKKKVKGLFK